MVTKLTNIPIYILISLSQSIAVYHVLNYTFSEIVHDISFSTPTNNAKKITSHCILN